MPKKTFEFVVRKGATYVAKDGYPQTFTNKTQATKKAEAVGPHAYVVQPQLGRVFMVMVPTKEPDPVAELPHHEVLAKKHGLDPDHPKVQKLYSLAYQMGHACGMSEVEIYYDDMSILLTPEN